MLARHLSHPLYAPIGAALAALSGALISQYIFGAHPCQLCIWQRYPYGAIITLGALAWFMRRHKAARLFLVVAGILFLATAAIACYHVGVEQGWVDAPSGCAVSMNPVASLEELKAQIMAAPLVSCKEAGASFLGLSMAAWNALYGLMCAVRCVMLYRTSSRS